MKPILAALAVAALLVFPETVLTAAQQAMYSWYSSVAPALFPFMALLPLLTCRESARIYERLLGCLTRAVFRLPGAAAPAVVVGMTAGSPAGAIAALRTCTESELTRTELERIVLCACGLSPAFLITGVGAAMLSNPADGLILLRAQLASQLILLICTRSAKPAGPLPPPEPVWHDEPVRAAARGILSVCGYMILFSAAAAVIARILRSETAGLIALALLDAPSGARAIAALSIEREMKLLLLAAVTGFGGLCIAAQNRAVSRIPAMKYLCFRLLHTALTTAATALQLPRRQLFSEKTLPALHFSALAAIFLAVPIVILWNNNAFLNKRNLGK